MEKPSDSKEFSDVLSWGDKKLEPVNCVAAWFDICGYGKALAKNKLRLEGMIQDGYVDLLYETHRILGYPLVVMPPTSEKILILNDGLARTCDVPKVYTVDDPATSYILYIREIFFKYKYCLRLCRSHKLGLRAVLSGGERVQYTVEEITGDSVLIRGETVSPFGEKVLQTTFLYNPSEFQMNAAFSKSYYLDSEGTDKGLLPNNIFVERSFWDKISLIPLLSYEILENEINIKYRGGSCIKLFISSTHDASMFGLNLLVDSVSEIVLNLPWENEVVRIGLLK